MERSSCHIRVRSLWFEVFDNMAAPLEARVKMVWRLSDRVYSHVYALKGFSDGSPDYGGGASAFLNFDPQMERSIERLSTTRNICSELLFASVWISMDGQPISLLLGNFRICRVTLAGTA